MRIGLRDMLSFFTKKLGPEILKYYKEFKILNECDFQFEVTRELRSSKDIRPRKAVYESELTLTR